MELPLPSGGEPTTELSFSDDTRLFARSRAGITRVLEVAEGACLASCCSLNPGKVRAYRIGLLPSGSLRCLAEGALVCGLGVLPMSRGSVQFAGLPVLMGDSPAGPVEKVLS